MAAQSKFIEAAVSCTCHEYVHPWTSSCVCGMAGIALSTIPTSFRIYTVVYLLALASKMRVPTLLDLKRTAQGMLTSSAFLCSCGYLFSMFVCLVRHVLGRFYFSTVAFVPNMFASILSISIERPERRTPLTLYVANVASEALWNMLEARGLLHSVPNAQAFILGCSLTALLYMYRVGVHKTKVKDISFKGVRILIGKDEEGSLKTPTVTTTQSSCQRPLNFCSISAYVQLYERLRHAKHPSCPHQLGCSTYALYGGLKPFLGGVGLQVGLKLLLNVVDILKLKMKWRKQIFNKGSLNLGLALGTFSLLYKGTSCALRNVCGHDRAYFAIPAGLLGSIGLLLFSNTTISLYVMWKTLHLLYSWGIKEQLLPDVPHFNMALYSVCTALLFHCAILEPNTLRSSYYKFLMGMSGNRICRFNVRAFDGFGVKSSDQVTYIIKKLKIDMTSPFPKYPLVV